ncbi:MAG TPA: hypothetical protein VGU45_03880 [Microvirga sp.]|jgi:hypothetical protein|nr:hypothetical protein [Microvirga sp.]
MSPPPKEPTSRKRASTRARAGDTAGHAPAGAADTAEPAAPVQTLTDPAANAALALAISSAKRLAPPALTPTPEAAPATAPPTDDKASEGEAQKAVVSRRPFRLQHAALAAVALVSLNIGWAGGFAFSGAREINVVSPDPARESQTELGALKAAVESLQETVKAARAEAEQGRAQVLGQLDKLPLEAAADLVRLGAQIKEAGLDGLPDRLERIERHLAGGAKPSAAAEAPAPQPAPAAAAAPPAAVTPVSVTPAPVSEAKAAPKDAPVEGWVLHEVYDGVALIESRNRRLLEVVPGETVPGVGRVEAIERRGKRWVVVTAKGVISTVR